MKSTRKFSAFFGILVACLAACSTGLPDSPQSASIGAAPADLKPAATPSTVPEALPTSRLGIPENDTVPEGTEEPESKPQPEPTGPGFPSIGAGELWIATQPHRQHLLLVKPDGTDPVDILISLPQEQFHPDWSPDGLQLTFEHAHAGPGAQENEIWSADANGDRARPLLTNYPASLKELWWQHPAWSPDGSSIAMVGYEGNAMRTLPARSVITIVDVESGEISVVADVAQTSGELHSFPRWSPDGKSFVIAVSGFDGEDFVGQAIAVIRKTEAGWSTPQVITPFDIFASRPDWHRSEDLIVFSTYDYGDFFESDEPSNLYTIRPDGTQLTPVTTFGPGEERASQPTWTADGRIIFTYVTGGADERQRPAFINADGLGFVVIDGLENLVHSRLRPGG